MASSNAALRATTNRIVRLRDGSTSSSMARLIADRTAEAHALIGVGLALHALRGYGPAVDHLTLAVDLFRAVADGRIKALWIMATNPVASLPNADSVREAPAACARSAGARAATADSGRDITATPERTIHGH